MILAAGFGTRLWPLTIGRTKPALPFLNRPLISFTIDYLRRYGFTDIIINLHHEPESVQDQIGDGSRFGVKISYSIEEPEILGTAGALDAVRDRLEGGTFVVINGKIITNIDLGAALSTHRQTSAVATLVLKQNSRREYFREVLVRPDGGLTGFGGFPDRVQSLPSVPLMFTGIHLLEPEIFDFIPRGVFSDSVADVYPLALAAGKTITGYPAEGHWYELSTIERYLAISLELWNDGKENLVADEGCQIDPTAVVTNSILWKRVEIEAGVRLDQCIVGDDVRIEAGSEFRRSVICRGTVADLASRPEKALPATLVNGNLVVPFG